MKKETHSNNTVKEIKDINDRNELIVHLRQKGKRYSDNN